MEEVKDDETPLDVQRCVSGKQREEIIKLLYHVVQVALDLNALQCTMCAPASSEHTFPEPPLSYPRKITSRHLHAIALYLHRKITIPKQSPLLVPLPPVRVQMGEGYRD